MRTLTALLAMTLPLQAQDGFELAFPVDCTLGETCMIQQTMDRDLSDGSARDFRCGPQTYDDHSGTDIRVPDMEALEDGVTILAAAPGRVLGVRNSVADRGRDDFPTGQDCGNGVVIEHAGGWQTQYCHMAQGSVTVASGQEVETGHPLGEMGFSGNTEFPHLHLTLRLNGEDVDPFDPSPAEVCGAGADPLWSGEIVLPEGGILSAGFSDGLPEYDAIQEGTADAASLPSDAAALVLWGFFHGGRPGDVVALEITAPDGSRYHRQEVTLERTRAQYFRASGRNNRTGLAVGDYLGDITLTRDGVVLDRLRTSIPVR